MQKQNNKAGSPDDVVLENPDSDPVLNKRKQASLFKGANISLHDIHSCVRVIDVMGERHGYKEDETEYVDALRQRLAKFLNINVPEGYDMSANREETREFMQAEQSKLDMQRNEDGSVDSPHANRLEPSGGAPYPM